MGKNEAFNIETATRVNILSKSIRRQIASNHMIRETLGWREIKPSNFPKPSSNFSKPKFQSRYIKELYEKIDWIAKHRLPAHDIEELYSVWLQDSPIRAEIEHLVVEYGEKIWNEPMHKRDPAANPHSHLLVAKKKGRYSMDLFNEDEHHRKYIQLQLEHLAYVKARALYFNTRRVKGMQGLRALPSYVDPTTPNDRRGWISLKTKEKFIVKLFISGAGLRKVRSTISKRKRNSSDAIDVLRPPKKARTKGQTMSGNPDTIETDPQESSWICDSPSSELREVSDRIGARIEQDLSSNFDSSDIEIIMVSSDCSNYEAIPSRSYTPDGVPISSSSSTPAAGSIRSSSSTKDGETISSSSNTQYDEGIRSSSNTKDGETISSSSNTQYDEGIRSSSNTNDGEPISSSSNTQYDEGIRSSSNTEDGEAISSSTSTAGSGAVQSRPNTQDGNISLSSIPPGGIATSSSSNIPDADAAPSNSNIPEKEDALVEENIPNEIDTVVGEEPVPQVWSPQAADTEKSSTFEKEDSPERIDQEPDLEDMREELRSLLHCEFANTNHAYLDSLDSDEMWENSDQVNALLKEIWQLDARQDTMDEGLYKKVDKMVNIWITWRDCARTLGVVAGLHPLQVGPVPKFTYAQWKVMLGGFDKYNEMDARLTRVRRYRKSGAPAVTDISEHVAIALASATRHPGGAEYYRDNIVGYNKKLFSWKLDWTS